MAQGFQSSGLGVDAEHNDRIISLVGDQAERTGRIEVEISRDINIGGFMFHERQRPLGGVNLEHRDTIVSPVGTVEKLSVRVYAYLGTRIGTLEVVGQRGYGLNRR